MMIRLSTFAAIIVAVHGQATAPPGGCLVCGDGKVVTNPDGIFTFPGQPTTPCGTLQNAGLDGVIPLDQCPFLPNLIAACACAPGDLPATAPTAPVSPPVAAPTSSPVPAPTSQPVPAPTVAPQPAPTASPGNSCPDTPATGCSVCGDGLCVSNPDGIFTFPGQPTTPCGTLQNAGYSGLVPLDQCPFLPGLIGATCGCSENGLPGSPVLGPVAAPVTSQPVPPTAPVTPPSPIPPRPMPTPSPTTSTPPVAPIPGGMKAMTGMGMTKGKKNMDDMSGSGGGKAGGRRSLGSSNTFREYID